MDLSLNKLPWYGQVGLFVALALGGVGVFYYFYVMPMNVDMEGRRKTLAELRANITKGSTTANQLGQFKAQVEQLARRCRQVIDRTGDVPHVDVRADRGGQ